MKKLISVIMSVIMAASVCSVAVIPAMAAKSVASPGKTTQTVEVNVEVNGSTTNDVIYDKDNDDPSVITFTYTGDGDITGWEFPGMELGVDYNIISESDDHKTITIQLIKDEDGNYVYDGVVTAKAIVDDTTAPTKQNTNKDKDSTSPKTGAVSAAGIAIAGAGVAILTALKKKKDEE